MTTTLDPFDPGTWSERERTYFEKVDSALALATNLLFSNGLPAHAVYLIERFFANAKKRVRLFSGNLRRTVGGVDVYGNPRVAKAVEKMLTGGVSLQIVLHSAIDVDVNETWIDHPLVRIADHLKKAGGVSGSLDIRQSSRDSIEHLRKYKFLNHWMVMDRTAYRLETDIRKAKAHVNFGDREMASALADIFDNVLFRSAEPLMRPA